MFFHMLASIPEFEHDLTVERTREGLAAARARGRNGGRRPKMNINWITQARAMWDTGDYTVREVAETIIVSRKTIYRHLERVTD